MRGVRAHVGKQTSRKATFVADQRGNASFEMVFVFGLLTLGFLLPLADVAITGFKYLSAVQALRSFGQSILYSPPIDLSDTTSWTTTAIGKADPKYPVSNFQLICGDGNALCSGT